MEVDWAGTQPQYQDPGTGQFVKASMFVSVLPYSQIIYAEVLEDQKLANWIAAHNHAFQYFGGIPRAITPDNLKTGVTESDWFSPVIQRTYQEMAAYYGTVVLPARPVRPRDTAFVEDSGICPLALRTTPTRRWVNSRIVDFPFHRTLYGFRLFAKASFTGGCKSKTG